MVEDSQGLRLACAAAADLAACGQIEDGDAVTLAPDGQCVRRVSAMPAAARLAAEVALDLNRASEADLELLPGIGPKLAHAMVKERARRGGFRSLDELTLVKGIGPKKLAQLRALVRVVPVPLGAAAR